MPHAAHRQDEVRHRLGRTLFERIRIRAQVDLAEPGGLPRQEVGKAQRVFEQVDDRDPLS